MISLLVVSGAKFDHERVGLGLGLVDFVEGSQQNQPCRRLNSVVVSQPRRKYGTSTKQLDNIS